MSSVRVDERLTDVFRSIFGSGVSTLADEDSPRTIAGWDSVTHIHLLTALETEFDVTFDPGEFAELVTVGAIRRRVARSDGDAGG